MQAPSYLFVQNADGGTLTESTLTLTGVSAQTGWFTDRPYREAGRTSTLAFLAIWDQGGDFFADNPPNADFTCSVDGEVVNHFLELTGSSVVGDDLIYAVQGIGDSDLPTELRCEDDAHLFIDDAQSDSKKYWDQYTHCIIQCVKDANYVWSPECKLVVVPDPTCRDKEYHEDPKCGNTTCNAWRETMRTVAECHADASKCPSY